MSKIPMKLAFFIVGSCGFLDDMKFQGCELSFFVGFVASKNVCLREECYGLIKYIYNQVNVCFIIDQLSIYPE